MSLFNPSLRLLVFGLLSLNLFSGCKKYEEGPVLSLRSRTERVANTWKVEKYIKNGKDLTGVYNGYIEIYTKDGQYAYSWTDVAGTGKWQFKSDDTELVVMGNHNQPNQTLKILKLEEKQFWYSYKDGDDLKEFHMRAN